MLQIVLLNATFGVRPSVFSNANFARAQELRHVRGHKDGHTYIVRLREAVFRPRGRKLVWHTFLPDCPLPCIQVGKHVRSLWGFDPAPDDEKRLSATKFVSGHNEVIGLSAIIDGRNYQFPSRLYDDLIEPGALTAHFSKNAEKLSIVLEGSDGAGSWTAHFTVRRKGRITRWVEGAP